VVCTHVLFACTSMYTHTTTCTHANRTGVQTTYLGGATALDRHAPQEPVHADVSASRGECGFVLCLARVLPGQLRTCDWGKAASQEAYLQTFLSHYRLNTRS
jgi:hypothetical protein